MQPNEFAPPDHTIHHHHFIHFWPFGNRGSGNYAPPATGGGAAGTGQGGPAAPTYPPAPRRWSDPPWSWLLWLALLAAIVLGIVWLASRIHFHHSHNANTIALGAATVPKPSPLRQSMPQILAAEHFNTSYHAICSWEEVSNGTAYKVFLNRGNSCRYTIQAIIPAVKDAAFRGRRIHRLNVTFVYDGTRYTPSQVKDMKRRLSLGQQVSVGLRNIVVRTRTP